VVGSGVENCCCLREVKSGGLKVVWVARLELRWNPLESDGAQDPCDFFFYCFFFIQEELNDMVKLSVLCKHLRLGIVSIESVY